MTKKILLMVILSLIITGCSSKTTLPPTSPPDTMKEPVAEDKTHEELMGFSPELSNDAQKLYAKARIMWDNEENCSQPELAMEYLDIAIALEPNYADAYIRRALAASETGEWDDAFNDSSQAIRLEGSPDNYALRSLIFMREGNYKGARKDLERALKLDPKNSRAKDYMQEMQRLEKEAL